MKHPAKFTESILVSIGDMLGNATTVLDPYAGTGRIHDLRPDFHTVGVEIEPEWAEMHPATVVGDALALPFADGSFDAVATSCCYGNRMADHHNARDASARVTYRHVLGRELHPNNSGQLQWGQAYRDHHWRAWSEVTRVVRPGGRMVLNVKDHVRKGQVQPVSAWHHSAFLALGWEPDACETVIGPGMRYGQNGTVRVTHEFVMGFRKPTGPVEPSLFTLLAPR